MGNPYRNTVCRFAPRDTCPIVTPVCLRAFCVEQYKLERCGSIKGFSINYQCASIGQCLVWLSRRRRRREKKGCEKKPKETSMLPKPGVRTNS
jgi:hypothetical protein